MVARRPRCPVCGLGISPGREVKVKMKDGSVIDICHRKKCLRAHDPFAGRRACSFPGYQISYGGS